MNHAVRGVSKWGLVTLRASRDVKDRNIIELNVCKPVLNFLNPIQPGPFR